MVEFEDEDAKGGKEVIDGNEGVEEGVESEGRFSGREEEVEAGDCDG